MGLGDRKAGKSVGYHGEMTVANATALSAIACVPSSYVLKFEKCEGKNVRVKGKVAKRSKKSFVLYRHTVTISSLVA